MNRRVAWALVALIAAGTALTGLLGYQLRDLRIRVHDLEFLPQHSVVLTVDEEVRRTFGSDARLIICFESTEHEVTSAEFLEDLDYFIRELLRSHNIGVLLLDRLHRPRFRAAPVAGEPYFLHVPDGAWIAQALRSSAVVRKLAVGSSHRSVFLETPALAPSGVRSIQVRVEEAFARLEQKKPEQYTVRVMGRDVVLNGLGEAVFEDLARLLPWAFLVMFVLLLAIFRSWLLAAMALLEVGMAVACTMGILQLLGFELSLMTALVPVLVTVLGIADEIHLYGEFLRLKAVHPERSTLALVREALGAVLFPITATTLTTAIGFSSFLVTDVPALRIFGLLSSIGVCFSWLFTLTVVPALLALVPVGAGPSWTRHSPPLNLPRFVRRTLPIGLSLVISGVFLLRIDDGWTRNFQPEHRLVRDVAWFQEESTGLFQFDLVLRRTDGRSWTEPPLLEALDRLVEEIERAQVVTVAVSVADLVRDRAWELGDPGAPRPPIPATAVEIERILDTFLAFNEQIFVNSFLDSERTAARLLVFTTGDDYDTSGRALAAVNEAVAQLVAHDVEIKIGGSAERGRVLIETVVSTQAKSVLALMLMSWLALGLASRQWYRSLRCVLVIGWALALVLGIAGWAGLSLGVASSCFLALGMGVGLDYAIHLAFGAGHQMDPMVHRRIHRRVLANVFVVGLGLAVLMLSANPTVAKLGLLIVLSMIASGYAVLVFYDGDPRPDPGQIPSSS